MEGGDHGRQTPSRLGGAEQAGAFLATRFGPGVANVALIGQGEWSQAYAFRHDGGDYVVRFGAFEEDFAKDRLAAAFASPALPIPRVTEIGEAFDGFYAISERVFGEPLDGLGAAEMHRALPALYAALDAARLVDVAGSTGYGPWGASGAAPHRSWRDSLLDVTNDRATDRVHGWRARLATSPTGEGAFTEGLRHLTSLLGYCPESRHLVHADLLNYNVFVAGDHIAGIIDWGCALYGDFLYDLAWLSFWAPWYVAMHGFDVRKEARRHYAAIGLDVPHFEERLRCYEVHIGLAAQAYNAFTGRWAELEATARRTLDVATQDR